MLPDVKNKIYWRVVWDEYGNIHSPEYSSPVRAYEITKTLLGQGSKVIRVEQVVTTTTVVDLSPEQFIKNYDR